MPKPIQILPQYKATSLDEYLKIPMALIQQRRELEKDYNDRLDQIATLEGMVGKDSKYLQDIHNSIDYATDMLYNQNGTIGDIAHTLNVARGAYRSMAPIITEGYNRWDAANKAWTQYKIAHPESVTTQLGTVDDFIADRNATWKGIDLASIRDNMIKFGSSVSSKRSSPISLVESDYPGYLKETSRVGFNEQERQEFYNLASQALNGDAQAIQKLTQSQDYTDLWNELNDVLQRHDILSEGNGFSDSDIERIKETSLKALVSGMTGNVKEAIRENKEYWWNKEQAAKRDLERKRAKKEAADAEAKARQALLDRKALGSFTTSPAQRTPRALERPGFAKDSKGKITFNPKDYLEDYRTQTGFFRKDVRIDGLNPFLIKNNDNTLTLIQDYNASIFKKAKDLVDKYTADNNSLNNLEKNTLRGYYKKITGDDPAQYDLDEIIERIPLVNKDQYDKIVNDLSFDGNVNVKGFKFDARQDKSLSDAFARQYGQAVQDSEESDATIGVSQYDVYAGANDAATLVLKDKYPNGIRTYKGFREDPTTGIYEAYDDSTDLIDLEGKKVVAFKFLPGRNSIIIRLQNKETGEMEEASGVIPASDFGFLAPELQELEPLTTRLAQLKREYESYLTEVLQYEQKYGSGSATSEMLSNISQYQSLIEEIEVERAKVARNIDREIQNRFFTNNGGKSAVDFKL